MSCHYLLLLPTLYNRWEVCSVSNGYTTIHKVLPEDITLNRSSKGRIGISLASSRSKKRNMEVLKRKYPAKDARDLYDATERLSSHFGNRDGSRDVPESDIHELYLDWDDVARNIRRVAVTTFAYVFETSGSKEAKAAKGAREK